MISCYKATVGERLTGTMLQCTHCYRFWFDYRRSPATGQARHLFIRDDQQSNCRRRANATAGRSCCIMASSRILMKNIFSIEIYGIAIIESSKLSKRKLRKCGATCNSTARVVRERDETPKRYCACAVALGRSNSS